MGFVQAENEIITRQITDGIFEVLTELEYHSKKGECIIVPKGFKTDGYSKPQFTEILVGGRYEDDLRPCILHDYLCKNKGYYKDGVYIKLGFNRVNDLFYEAMISAGMSKTKALVMRFAVNFNFSWWF